MYNLFGRDFRADPYPIYAALRAENPVYRRATSSEQRNATCFITGYNEAVTILRDSTHFVKDYRNALNDEEKVLLPQEPPLVRLLSRHMLNSDPPEHTRLRALVNKAFSVRMIDQLEERIQIVANQLIEQALRKHGSVEYTTRQGEFDVIEEFAFPLPIIVIADLLGIPTRDRNRFRAWSHAIVQPSANSQRNEKKELKSRQLMNDFVAYLRQILADRKKTPRDDLITSLLQAEEAGDVLSEDEIFSTILLLVVVGHETSVNLIGNSLLTLLKHPSILQQLQEQPGLIPTALEELIRYDGPVERAPMRFAAEDIEISGTQIKRGDAISVVLAAANRDPAQFDCPDQLNILRQNNKHIGFGLGIHYCLGAPLARAEGRIALETLLSRFDTLALTIPIQSLRWHTNPIMRGLHRLPIRFTTKV